MWPRHGNSGGRYNRVVTCTQTHSRDTHLPLWVILGCIHWTEVENIASAYVCLYDHLLSRHNSARGWFWSGNGNGRGCRRWRVFLLAIRTICLHLTHWSLCISSFGFFNDSISARKRSGQKRNLARLDLCPPEKRNTGLFCSFQSTNHHNNTSNIFTSCHMQTQTLLFFPWEQDPHLQETLQCWQTVPSYWSRREWQAQDALP